MYHEQRTDLSNRCLYSLWPAQISRTICNLGSRMLLGMQLTTGTEEQPGLRGEQRIT